MTRTVLRISVNGTEYEVLVEPCQTLADVIRDARRDTALVALGVSAEALALVCDQVADLSDGVIMALPASTAPDGPASDQAGGYVATSGHGGPGHPVSGA